MTGFNSKRDAAAAKLQEDQAKYGTSWSKDGERIDPMSVYKEPAQKCWCTTCRPITMDDMRFVVCPDCGNKRCPKANDHRNACTNSNEVGQKGSSWEHVKPLAQPAQEPVAWTTMPESEDWCFVSGNKDPNNKLDGKWFPLYAAPPQRTWVGLTDEDIGQWIEEEHDVLRWAEAKLKEKNT